MKTTLFCINQAVCISFSLMAITGCSTTAKLEQVDKQEIDANPYPGILVGRQEWPQLVTFRLVEDLENTKQWEALNQDTKAKLAKTVSLSGENLELEEVIQFIRDTTGVNTAVNWPALELVGIDQDSVSTVSLNNVPAEQLLRIALNQVSADAFDDDKAHFRIHKGIILVSTRCDLNSMAEMRVYDIRPLLYQTQRLQASLYRDHERAAELIALLKQDPWLELDAAPGFDLNEALSGTNSGGSTRNKQDRGEAGLLGKEKDKNNSDPEEHVTVAERVAILIEVIQTTIADPDQWIEGIYYITELNGNLIIRTTPDDHKDVESLLNRLNKIQAEHFKDQTKAIEVFLLLQDAETFRLKQDYKSALIKIDQALRVDPSSMETNALKETINATLSR